MVWSDYVFVFAAAFFETSRLGFIGYYAVCILSKQGPLLFATCVFAVVNYKSAINFEFTSYIFNLKRRIC